jgi:MFS family permease
VGVLERFGLATRGRQGLSIRIAVALAFADASIAVLALPQIIGEFDTTIRQVTWVIMAYNVGLIVAVVPIVFAARRLPSGPALVAGLTVFGLASIGCGLAESFGWLVALRCVQGVGGADRSVVHGGHPAHRRLAAGAARRRLGGERDPACHARR